MLALKAPLPQRLMLLRLFGEVSVVKSLDTSTAGSPERLGYQDLPYVYASVQTSQRWPAPIDLTGAKIFAAPRREASRRGAASMLTLKACCPGCHSEIDTGLNADPYILAQWQDDLLLVLCHHCRKDQNLPVKDLYESAQPKARASEGRISPQ